ncbi:MAG: CocE/NonD family hydrolase [bacterium]
MTERTGPAQTGGAGQAPVAAGEPIVRDGMLCAFDVPIAMDDGVVLRADVFRPVGDGRFPVLLTYGPYAKGLAFQDGYPSAWQRMVAEHPDVAYGSSKRYQNWEVVDPE